VYGGTREVSNHPHWKDYILFFEYFHGDNGAGLGASHQTGWTGVVAKLIDLSGASKGNSFWMPANQALFAKGKSAG